MFDYERCQARNEAKRAKMMNSGWTCNQARLVAGTTFDRNQRDLLEPGEMIVFVRLALGGGDLLDEAGGGQKLAKILRVSLLKSKLIRQIVQVNVCGRYLIKIHVGFFEIVEKIAHGLAELMLSSCGVYAAMRPWYKSILGGAIQGVAGKNAGTGRRTWRHVLWAHRMALLEIAHGYDGIFDVG